MVIDRIRAAVDAGRTKHWLKLLFNDVDWRPHLVGCVASILWDKGHVVIPNIWGAIDKGSWATPQLVATAHTIDPKFIDNATKRVLGGCPVKAVRGLSILERQSARGAADNLQRSATTFSSIAAMCERNGDFELVEHWKKLPELQNVINTQCCPDGHLAILWIEFLKETIKNR